MVIAPLHAPFPFKGLQYSSDDLVSGGTAIKIDSDIGVNAEHICQVLWAIMALPKSVEDCVFQVCQTNCGEGRAARRHGLP